MILPIYIYGQPVLRKVAEDINADYPDLKQLITDMFETLTASDGVGLAGPQIGKAIRLVVIDLSVLAEDFPEYKDFRKAYINAHILEKDDAETESLEEGCLSLPGIHEKVVGYLARVMQHEFDHLDGSMFIDHLSPLRKQLIKGKLKALLQGRVRCSYRVKTVKK